MPRTVEIREHTHDPTPVLAAYLELRPALRTAERLLSRIAEVRTGTGLRVLGAHLDGEPQAAGLATYRVYENVAYGRVLYVDDLVVAAAARRAGVARALLAELDVRADQEGCDDLQLDSALGSERAAAHGLYFASGLRITAFHFGRDRP